VPGVTELVRRRIIFECGHRARYPEDWTVRIVRANQKEQPQISKHWHEQSPPLGLGSVAVCPGCPGSRGRPQIVVGVIALPIPAEREFGH
jgi:hypothetical protein